MRSAEIGVGPWLAPFVLALLAAAGAGAGGGLTPQERRALEKEAKSLNEQGAFLFLQGNFPEAATAALEKALALRRKLYPKGDHSDLAQSLNNLGEMRYARGDLAGTE